jgi:hypothetical protein
MHDKILLSKRSPGSSSSSSFELFAFLSGKYFHQAGSNFFRLNIFDSTDILFASFSPETTTVGELKRSVNEAHLIN